MKESRMRFVLSHYKDGLKSPDDALADVYEKAGINRRNTRSAYRRTFILTASGIAASLLLVISFAMNRRNAWTEYRADASKAIVSLADGTMVTLAPGTVIKLQERKNPRHVELEGNAFFDVARDGSHPFTVAAGTGTVRVLGTRFLVSHSIEGMSVDVTDGRVLFSSAGDEEGLVLTKGMSAILSIEEDTPSLVDQKMPNPAAWATGEFNYHQTRLCDALAELASFYGVELSTSDGADPNLTFTGRFSSDSLDDILYAIESALDVKIAVR